MNKLKIRREIEFEAKMIRILSLLKIFELKKSELTQNFDTWSIFEQEFNEKLNGSNFELTQNLMHIPSRDKSSFDDFLSLLKILPVSYTVADQKVTHFLQILEILKNVKNILSWLRVNDVDWEYMLICIYAIEK